MPGQNIRKWWAGIMLVVQWKILPQHYTRKTLIKMQGN